MKRLLQLVALSIVAMLALPHAVALGLCLAPHSSQQMHCFARSDDSSNLQGSHGTEFAAPVVLGEICQENCSVSPQSTPPAAAEQATSGQVPLIQAGVEPASLAKPALPLFPDSRGIVTATDRQALLHVFRI